MTIAGYGSGIDRCRYKESHSITRRTMISVLYTAIYTIDNGVYAKLCKQPFFVCYSNPRVLSFIIIISFNLSVYLLML